MNTSHSHRIRRSRGAGLPLALGAFLAMHLLAGRLAAMIIVSVPGIQGSVTVGNLHFESAFVADSFSFGVEREFSSTGEKGGTEDINIGVGELQECTISKSLDRASTKLAQFAINGNSLGTADIYFVEVAGPAGKPYCYLAYKLDRCFVKSWSTSGDADDRPTEEVAFYYNKIAFIYRQTQDGINFENFGPMSWDNVKNTPWADSGVSFDPPRPLQ